MTVIPLNRYRPHKAELQAFSRAVIAVLKIKRRYGAEMISASAEADIVSWLGRRAIRTAIHREGLTKASYDRILAAVRDNANIRYRVRCHVAENSVARLIDLDGAASEPQASESPVSTDGSD